MKVHVQKMVEVELDGPAIEEVFLRRLDQLCGGEHVYIAKDGAVESWEDTGHGSGLTEKVKKPTVTQIAALKFRETLKEVKRLAAEVREQEAKRRRRPIA